jgi:hypothetical protein
MLLLFVVCCLLISISVTNSIGTKGESRAIEGIKVWLEAAPVAFIQPQPVAYIQPSVIPVPVPIAIQPSYSVPAVAPVYPGVQPVTGTSYPGYPQPAPPQPYAPQPAYAPAPVAAPGGIVTTSPRGKFFLTSAHKTQISAHNNGALMQSPNRAGWEVLIISDVGNGRVTITTAHNTQLSCSDYGAVSCSPNRGHHESWSVVPSGNGKWYVIAHTGNHLGMDSNGTIYCSNRNTGPWEQWDLSTA